MADPLSYLPFALAAGGGTIDGHEAGRLVAAGLTLLQRSAPLVRALAGRRAAILLPTSPAFVTALAACDGRGAVLVNPLAAPPEIAWQLDDADVGAVFTTAALAPRLPAGMVHVLLDEAPRRARVQHAGGAAEVDLGSHFGLELEGRQDAGGADEECAIVYTSAMSGTPLGAILTHRNLLANARSTVAAAAQQPSDHVLALLPWSHLFGLTVTASAPLLAGARVTTMPRFHPGTALDLLAAGDVTEVVGVPAIFKALLDGIVRRGGRIETALRLALCGGAPLDPVVQDRWFEATGTELRQGYGLTEAGPVCLFNALAAPNVRGTLGRPMPGVDVAIARPEPGPVQLAALGEQGEIVVRGANVFAGYVSGGEAGLQRVPGDGGGIGGSAATSGVGGTSGTSGAGTPGTGAPWLRTGDLGVRRPDGSVEFAGIAKAMFTRNGFNVYPRELEAVIGAMPGVESVAVTGSPHPAREHDIVAAIRGAVTEREVRAWCAARLAAYKQPDVIRIG